VKKKYSEKIRADAVARKAAREEAESIREKIANGEIVPVREVRLDKYLAEQNPAVSRATFQKLIANDRVEVNGKHVRDAKYLIRENDQVKFFMPHALTFEAEIKAFAKNVIFEDENVVVVNKPAGILTHSKGDLNDEFTVADFVKTRIKTDDDVFAKSNRPGIVHRLDRATSGVLIAAKNPETAAFLQKQFSERKAHKTYFAITESAPKIAAARIDLPIARNPKHPAEFRVDARGKTAITDYETEEMFANGSALVELKPQTGRTHQLRVHMEYIGAPIVGDAVYGNGKAGERMFLHAASLEITIPGEPENSRKIFSADLPEDFREEIQLRSGIAKEGRA
jgi:23S rRNA pseudouridine1911/1915/1917 synthase